MSSPPPPIRKPPVVGDNLHRTTEAPGQTTDEGKGRSFPCDGCGADLTFNIGVQQLKCPYCGYEKQIEIPQGAQIVEQDFHAMLEKVRQWHEQGRETVEGFSEVRCEACGGTVVFPGPITSTKCPYCAKPIQRENVHTLGRRVSVDGVMPFKVDEKLAKHNLGEWVRSRWFAPNDFLKHGVNGTFNGVYMPYWTYDTHTANAYRGERGEHYYVTVGSGKNKRTERRTRWYPASGQFQRFFDDVMVLASRGLNREKMLALEPWPLGKCVPFNQQMLAGYLARTYEVELDEGFQDAKGRIDAAIASEVRARIGGDDQRVHSIHTLYNAITCKHLLLPVWLLAYRYRETAYQTMVNAATGEVQGERPYSWVKILLTILLCLVLVASVLAVVALMNK